MTAPAKQTRALTDAIRAQMNAEDDRVNNLSPGAYVTLTPACPDCRAWGAEIVCRKSECFDQAVDWVERHRMRGCPGPQPRRVAS